MPIDASIISTMPWRYSKPIVTPKPARTLKKLQLKILRRIKPMKRTITPCFALLIKGLLYFEELRELIVLFFLLLLFAALLSRLLRCDSLLLWLLIIMVAVTAQTIFV